jgi:hypothetical protein
MTHLERFRALTHLLTATQNFWQLIAFEHKSIPWPQFEDMLNQLSEEEVVALEQDNHALNQFLATAIPELKALSTLIELPQNAQQVVFPFWLTNGVRGRKIGQLAPFVAAVNERELPTLEWCAGKGHLGRMLVHNGAPSCHSVELQPQLVAEGNALAQQHKMPIRFSELDALSEQASSAVATQQHAIALHACGGLHQALMRHACAKKTARLSISPCCYHLFQTDPAQYQAMSQSAQQSGLTLFASDLKLALQETVTSGQRITKLRHIETHWRLAFDALLDDVLGKTRYLSVPSINKAMFSSEFSHFCRWAAEVKGIALPTQIDYDFYLSQGLVRKGVSQRIELVRHGFRRAIELWLVLDRVLYLEEQGYQVTVSEFCQHQVTPRNILIRAQYQG